MTEGETLGPRLPTAGTNQNAAFCRWTAHFKGYADAIFKMNILGLLFICYLYYCYDT
jgi:hypothetical protein